MSLIRGKKVLHVGCGPKSREKLHDVFHGDEWREVRLDIDEKVDPDIVGDMTNMSGFALDGEYDAVWSSHNIEHLFAHEAPIALKEFRRILRQDGFALITCPDVHAIARLIVAGRFDQTIYESPAGPISPVDMLWGHARAISEGNHYMAHKTGYTTDNLGRLLIEAGFDEAWVFPGPGYNLWAVALTPKAARAEIKSGLARSGLRVPGDTERPE